MINSFNMSSYICSYCNKSYVRKSAFNNHKITCQFMRNCNNIKTHNEDQDQDQDQELDIKFNGNISDMYKLLINLYNKFQKLETDYNELKKYAHQVKTKINVIDYLNKNFDCSDFDFIKFINSIQISDEELKLVFDKDYVDAIYQIIIDNIQKIKNQNINIPIKAFNNKDGLLYICIYCDDNPAINYKWININENDLKFIFKYFNKNLLPLFLKWKEDNQEKFEFDDSFTKVYVKNMKRVLGTNFEKKNINAMLQNKLYKHLKINVKDISEFDLC